MAMIDYGAIAFKNGKLISTEFFTPMEETCGFSDYDKKLPKCDESFDGNYFVTLGDEDFVIGFYKNYVHWWKNNKELDEDDSCRYEEDSEWFSNYPYRGWKYWTTYIDDVDIIVKPKNGYYVARFEYKGDKYKVYFGYGVDLAWYKKTRLVNYYRTCPKIWWQDFKNWVYNIFHRW